MRRLFPWLIPVVLALIMEVVMPRHRESAHAAPPVQGQLPPVMPNSGMGTMPGAGSMPVGGGMPPAGGIPMPGAMPPAGGIPMPGAMPVTGGIPMPGAMPVAGAMPTSGRAPAQIPGVPSMPPGQPKATSLSSSFIDEIRNLRDPFKQMILIDNSNMALNSEIQSIPLEQLHLIAILTGPNRVRAMVKGPSGKIYTVHEGERIGNRNGTIRRIEDDRIQVRESVIDLLGEREIVDNELLLMTEKKDNAPGSEVFQTGEAFPQETHKKPPNARQPLQKLAQQLQQQQAQQQQQQQQQAQQAQEQQQQQQMLEEQQQALVEEQQALLQQQQQLQQQAQSQAQQPQTSQPQQLTLPLQMMPGMSQPAGHH